MHRERDIERERKKRNAMRTLISMHIGTNKHIQERHKILNLEKNK